MARMKNKSELGEENIQKMVREYWETLESDQGQRDSQVKDAAG